MQVRIVKGYIISSIIFGFLFFLFCYVLQILDYHFVIITGSTTAFIFLLFWIFVGVVNGLFVGLIKTVTSKAVVELFLCMVICCVTVVVFTKDVKTAEEGIFVLFAGAGIISGVFIFSINKFVQRYLK